LSGAGARRRRRLAPDSTSDKPNAETAYFRKRFYFSVDGEVVSTPGCPAVMPEG
jgi:hypothetical protein